MPTPDDPSIPHWIRPSYLYVTMKASLHLPVPSPRGEANNQPSCLLTVEEAARSLRIGRSLCYDLIRQGQIPHIRLGRLIRVPSFGLESWLARQAGLPEPPPQVISFKPQVH